MDESRTPVTLVARFSGGRGPNAKPYDGVPVPGVTVNAHGMPFCSDYSRVLEALKDVPGLKPVPLILYDELGLELPHRSVEEFFNVQLTYIQNDHRSINGWNVFPTFNPRLPTPKILMDLESVLYIFILNAEDARYYRGTRR